MDHLFKSLQNACVTPIEDTLTEKSTNVWAWASWWIIVEWSTEGAVCSTSCSRQYIAQTGRCINIRMCEHHNNVKKADNGHLDGHSQECHCYPDSRKCSNIHNNPCWPTREITEAYKIRTQKLTRASCPSLLLTEKWRICPLIAQKPLWFEIDVFFSIFYLLHTFFVPTILYLY